MSTVTTSSQTVPATPSRGLHYGLWAVQVLLAVMFFAAGLMKATQPLDVLAEGMPWVSRSSGALVRFVGVAELLGAVGLILPAATRILPWLTPLAAAGLVAVMALAIPMHGLNGEASGIPVNVVIGAIAAFVVWGRWVKAPIAAR